MTRRLSRRALMAAWVAAMGVGAAAPVRSESGAVKLLMPVAFGSGIDVVARSVQQALARAFDAPVVIENQPGASSMIGLQALARAVPDGKTLSIVSNSVVIIPSVFASLPFDMPGDFTPIAILGNLPIVLVVNPAKVEATDCRQFIALLKSRPGELNFASGGTGTILHLATHRFLEEAGAAANHVPYKGVGPMLIDLLGGQVEFATAVLGSVLPHLRSGALRPIGLFGARRTPAAPGIPTFSEQGLPGLVVEAWFAVIGPKGMRADQVKRVHGAFVAAFAEPAVMDAMDRQGNIIDITPPGRAEVVFRKELEKYARLIKEAGIAPR